MDHWLVMVAIVEQTVKNIVKQKTDILSVVKHLWILYVFSGNVSAHVRISIVILGVINVWKYISYVSFISVYFKIISFLHMYTTVCQQSFTSYNCRWLSKKFVKNNQYFANIICNDFLLIGNF